MQTCNDLSVQSFMCEVLLYSARPAKLDGATHVFLCVQSGGHGPGVGSTFP